MLHDSKGCFNTRDIPCRLQEIRRPTQAERHGDQESDFETKAKKRMFSMFRNYISADIAL